MGSDFRSGIWFIWKNGTNLNYEIGVWHGVIVGLEVISHLLIFSIIPGKQKPFCLVKFFFSDLKFLGLDENCRLFLWSG